MAIGVVVIMLKLSARDLGTAVDMFCESINIFLSYYCSLVGMSGISFRLFKYYIFYGKALKLCHLLRRTKHKLFEFAP